MKDITDIITELTGKEFKQFEIKDFVPEIVKRCTKEDLLFPLLDFLVRSVDNISAMEFKRYDNSQYCDARDRTDFGMKDPTLVETVRGMLLLMINRGIVNVTLKDK